MRREVQATRDGYPAAEGSGPGEMRSHRQNTPDVNNSLDTEYCLLSGEDLYTERERERFLRSDAFYVVSHGKRYISENTYLEEHFRGGTIVPQ